MDKSKSDSVSGDQDLNISLPDVPDPARLRKVLKTRARLIKRKKELEERIVDWDKEEEEEKLHTEEITINKVLVEIEKKLLQYNILKDVSDECKSILVGDFHNRIFIAGTGNALVNERLTAAVREKCQNKAKGTFGVLLSGSEIENIVIAVTEEQMAEGVTIHLPPLNTDKAAFDAFVLNAATIIHRTVKDARFKKDYDDYLTQEEVNELNAKMEDDPAPSDPGFPLDLAFAIMQREGDAEKKEGMNVEELGGIDLSENEAEGVDEQEEEDDMDEGSIRIEAGGKPILDEKPTATQLNNILNAKTDVDISDNISACALGNNTQVDMEFDIKEELQTQDMSIINKAPMGTSAEDGDQVKMNQTGVALVNQELKENGGDAELQITEELKDAAEGHQMAGKIQMELGLQYQKEVLPEEQEKIPNEDGSAKILAEVITPRDMTITITSGSFSDMADKPPLIEDDLLPQKDISDSQKATRSRVLDGVAKDVAQLKHSEHVTSKPEWLKGNTVNELVDCFIAHTNRGGDADVECIFENVKEHEDNYGNIDTSQYVSVIAWLEKGQDRENPPIEVITLVDSDEEEEEKEEEGTAHGKRAGSNTANEGEPPVRKLKIAGAVDAKSSPLSSPDRD